jgi:TPR repeat protein
MLKLKLLLSLFIILLSSVSNSSELHGALLDKANSGNVEANYHLGMLYNNGIGVEKSPNRAFELFLKAAENGDALGHYKVGCYYAGQFGKFDGIILNKSKAFEHKLIAAEAGYSFAQNDIAAAYYRNGDTPKAVEWSQKAGEQGHIQSLSNLLSLYQMPDSQTKSVKDAYIALLKIESLIPKNERLEELKTELEGKLNDKDVKQIKNQIGVWKPKASPLTQQAMQGITRSKLIAGISIKD